MHVRQKNFLEGRNIQTTSSDALEGSTAYIHENPWLSVDGHEVSS
jgi:ElaB/YqjD/DUF883 family membrane-anchored ribosome-binding protein